MRDVQIALRGALCVALLGSCEASEPVSPTGSSARALWNEHSTDVFQDLCYLNATQIEDEFRVMAARNPGIAELVHIGRSEQGRPLLALHIANRAIQSGGGVPLVVTAGLHGNEVPGPEVVRGFAELLTTRYGLDPDITWLIDHRDIWLLPLINPDGYMANAPLRGRRFNSDDVDLNRNFDYFWNGDAFGAGARAGSAIETQHVQSFLRSVFTGAPKPAGTEGSARGTMGVLIDVHERAGGIFYPWGMEPVPGSRSSTPPDEAALHAMGLQMSELAGFGPPRTSRTMYTPTTHGMITDYAYGQFSAASITFELLGRQSFATCEEEKREALREALMPLLYAAKLAFSPYRKALGPVLTSLGNSYSSFRGQLSTAYTSQAPIQGVFADVYRRSPSGTYLLPSSGLCRNIGGFADDGAFDSADESFALLVPWSCLSPGLNYIEIRGHAVGGSGPSLVRTVQK